MESMASQVRNHNSHNDQEAPLERSLEGALKKTANFHCQSNATTPTQPSSTELEIADVCTIILINDDDDHADREISDDNFTDLGASSLLSDIKEDYLDNQHNVLHPDQAHHGKTLQITRVHLPKQWNSADTVIACISLANL
jgi:hypothetical protein